MMLYIILLWARLMLLSRIVARRQNVDSSSFETSESICLLGRLLGYMVIGWFFFLFSCTRYTVFVITANDSGKIINAWYILVHIVVVNCTLESFYFNETWFRHIIAYIFFQCLIVCTLLFTVRRCVNYMIHNFQLYLVTTIMTIIKNY